MTAVPLAGDPPAWPPAPTAAEPVDEEDLDGVRLRLVRPGDPAQALFLVPGLEGDLTELDGLVRGFDGPQQVYALAPAPQDAQGRAVQGVERMAQLMAAAVRGRQPAGPYRLGGYSFGALLALEMAQQLRGAGDTVEALFLIEAVFDERYWPRGTWLRALARRTGWQLVRIARMPPARAAGEIRRRGVRLGQRVLRRRAGSTDVLRLEDPGTSRSARAYAAIGGYRPRPYPGGVTLIASAVDRHFGCDTARLWTGYADRLDVQRIDGDHLTIVQEPASAAAIARVIDHRLALARPGWCGLRPEPGFAHPMIVSTMRWFSAARLAHALTEAGFAVSACRPGRHPIELVEGLTADFRLNRMWRSRSLARAIRRARPDLVLPDDERALDLLRRLHARTRTSDPEVADTIARSLGQVAGWPAIASRAAVAAQSRALALPAPETAVLSGPESLRAWTAERGLPVVLKTDGSWGGRGVAIVRAAADLEDAWRSVAHPRLSRAVKRLIVNGEAGLLGAWLGGNRPVVNAQQFLAGREAIATVACLDGAVRTLVCLEVVRASESKGPASVVRVVDHPAMAQTARRLVERFGLSGFCGFDFIIDAGGVAHLLELNPRITPTAHLLVEGDHQRSRTIALFPRELTTAGEGGGVGILDVPVRAPALIERGQSLTMREHRPVARLARQLKQRLHPTKY